MKKVVLCYDWMSKQQYDTSMRESAVDYSADTFTVSVTSPFSKWSITAVFTGLYFSSNEKVPVTPLKSLILAKALLTSCGSVEPASLIA